MIQYKNLSDLIGKRLTVEYYPYVQTSNNQTILTGKIEKVIPKGTLPEVDNTYVSEDSPVNRKTKSDRLCFIDAVSGHHIIQPIPSTIPTRFIRTMEIR